MIERAPADMLRDLSVKASDDAAACVRRTAMLLWHADDMFGVALGATAGVLGLATLCESAARKLGGEDGQA